MFKLYTIPSIYIFIFQLLLVSCVSENTNSDFKDRLPSNILNYQGHADSSTDRSSLAFSDQGAWFAYGFSDNQECFGSFSGPFLMTQENGIWSSSALSNLILKNSKTGKMFQWDECITSRQSYNSHLSQTFQDDQLLIEQQLVYSSPHTALIHSQFLNKTKDTLILSPEWWGRLQNKSLKITIRDKVLRIDSDKSSAIGFIKTYSSLSTNYLVNDSSYSISLGNLIIEPGKNMELTISQSFIFPEYDWESEQQTINSFVDNFEDELNNRIKEKEIELYNVSQKLDPLFKDSAYYNLLAKCILTLQNNWRVPAGELKHSGIFPSYHYIWFHGYWAWDSWKHAVAIAKYNTPLAKEQIRAMFYFQESNGFIPDCIYRDTTIEDHNYRNTKPPLSAWAVWEVYKQDKDNNFLKELYSKIKRQHNWWYLYRDYDQDSLCEYGSTDGTLIAAKWESGMDNAVRFDKSQILKNSNSAFSLNQESVDLNSYLYKEKIILSKIANKLGRKTESTNYLSNAKSLKEKIQTNFFDNVSGWFYDKSIDGEIFIKVMGCEGWIPLWTNIATRKQAEFIKENIMLSTKFNTFVPLQTLSADHPDFEPDGGYWRGPNWIDQAYFGVIGLRNYGYYMEAHMLTKKIFKNAEGLLEKGKSIRENYNPISGEGLESENFSWSAAHLLLLLLEEGVRDNLN